MFESWLLFFLCPTVCFWNGVCEWKYLCGNSGIFYMGGIKQFCVNPLELKIMWKYFSVQFFSNLKVSYVSDMFMGN
jgi:hypothetical protein